MTYKRFPILQTSISAFFIIIFLFAGNAYANDALFTVRGVEVDVTADNALAAREEAFQQAQVIAFETLKKRLVADGQATPQANPDPVNLAAMIKDYEVNSEKLSSVRYVGNYTFRFKSQAVKKYFSGSAVNYTDISSEPILIFPYYQKNGQFDLWSYNNEWREAWERTDTYNALVPIVVPVGDLQDVSDMSDQNAKDYDPKRLHGILSRYGAKEAVIAIAIPDDGFNQDEADPTGKDIARGALSIDLYRTDKFGPQHVAQFFVKASGDQTRKQVFDQAVSQVQKTLSTNWKNKTVISAQETSQLIAHIAINSLGDWTQKQKTLREISSITDLKVESLTPRKAIVKITYNGDKNHLELALDQQNMVLALMVEAHGQVPVYELKVKQNDDAGTTQSFQP